MSPKRCGFIFLFLLLCVCDLSGQNLYLKAMGETELETKAIDSLGYKTSFDNYAGLASEIELLKSKLSAAGYIEHLLKDLIKENDTLYRAQFHLRTKYESIRIDYQGIVDIDLIKRLDFLNKDDELIIPIPFVESTLETINTSIANQGNPFSSLIVSDIKKLNNKQLQGTLSVSESKARTIDKLIIKGYEKFPRSFVKRYLKIKTGEPFNLEEIKSKTSDLNDLIFANQIKDPEVLFTNDSTILYMYIEKVRSNTFDGFLGFGTNETTNKLEFDGYLDLNLTNNLNYGESLRLLYKSDENDQQTFDLRLDAPYLFKSPVGVNFNLNIFRRDSSFVTVSQTAKINYQINSRQLISAGISTVNSTDLLDIPTAAITDFSSNQFILNYVYTKRQNYDPLFPINFLFDITGGTGNRSFGDIDEQQSNFTINTYKIFNLNDRNSIYGRISGNYLISDNYLENELPRFGGINSIRGFEENSLIANLFGVLNTEYRYKLNSSIYVHSVIDAAYFENQVSDQKGKLFGFGFGFGLLTKAGLFRFNYTSAKTENQKFRLSDSKIHISLTTRF